ncbi:hypothetical protein GGR52DRAFT_547379 [Hypoxylon sp. FL1284]|nr:hypothetical protein GGR52DRAFT_547379 [Hypoxylon sp. FL1284]
MAIVPWTSTCSYPCTAGFVYRAEDGHLAGYFVQQESPGLDWTFNTDVTIPEKSAMAGFAVAKLDDTNNGTNAYVLFQNEDDDVEFLAYSDNTWKSSKTLKGADAGTDIACVTESIWNGTITMSSDYDMSRCYFLSGGQVREVLYDGTGWKELGNIPLS